MKIIIVPLLGVIGMFCACSSSPKNGKEEKIIAFSLDYAKQEISFTAVSSGCTVKNDFEFDVKSEEILVKRKKKDECKAMPEAVNFLFSMKEAGISPDKAYKLKNRFIANPNLAAIQ